MAVDVTLTCNSTALASYLSTYKVRKEITWGKIIKTLGGKESAAGKKERLVVTFSFRPLSDSEASTVYAAIIGNAVGSWTFTNRYTGTTTTTTMRLASDLDEAFGIKSGTTHYYKGGAITIREVQAA